MHALKSFINLLSHPLFVATTLFVVAFLVRRGGKFVTANVVAALAAAIAFFSAVGPVADRLLGPLEGRYPALADGPEARAAYFIVVLGSDYDPQPNVPITAQFGGEGLARVVEGVRLARIYHKPLIVSGGPVDQFAPSAIGYARLARDLGIDPGALIVSAVGFDTRSESVAIGRLVGSKPYLLVTSASHMPRAVTLLRRAGTYPVPAPTAQKVATSEPMSWRNWVPEATALHATEMALHEYIGLLAIKLGLD